MLSSILKCAIVAACLTANSFALAQGLAGKPITIIVPYAAGGTTDITARVVAQQLSESLGRPVVVENRTGGGGVIGWGSAARAAPDGATLVTTDTSYAMAAGLFPKLPFDPKKDFAQITTAVSVPYVMVVNPAVSAKTVQEFIALTKAKPGTINYGSGGNGSSTHLGAELFRSASGADITHVPYKGAAAALQDVMGGQIEVLFTAVPTALPHIKSGKLRPLMVTSEKRVAALPDVPSAPEAGLPKMIADNWFGFAAPARTPPETVDQLNKEIVKALESPAAKRRFDDLGLAVVGNTPAQATKLVDDEIQRWSTLIKSAKIKPD